MEQLKRTAEMMAEAQEDGDRLLQRIHLECLLNQLWNRKVTEKWLHQE